MWFAETNMGLDPTDIKEENHIFKVEKVNGVSRILSTSG